MHLPQYSHCPVLHPSCLGCGSLPGYSHSLSCHSFSCWYLLDEISCHIDGTSLKSCAFHVLLQSDAFARLVLCLRILNVHLTLLNVFLRCHPWQLLSFNKIHLVTSVIHHLDGSYYMRRLHRHDCLGHHNLIHHATAISFSSAFFIRSQQKPARFVHSRWTFGHFAARVCDSYWAATTISRATLN